MASLWPSAWGQEDLVITTLSRGKQMFHSQKLPEKKGQALGLGGGHTCGGGKSVQADILPL